MNVTMVSTAGIACGIAEYGAYLKAAVEAADPDIYIGVQQNLHPVGVLQQEILPDWVLLNYHAALHSQWHPTHVQEVQRRGAKVLIVYHDSGVPNSGQCKGLHAVADCFVVHEPAEDLPGAVYLRQGVQAGASPWMYSRASPRYGGWLAYPDQPILGTTGFNQPWREFDRIAEVSAACGWAVVILSANATEEDEARWRRLNPHLECHRAFLPVDQVVSRLVGCDATIFIHACANTGTSGAIRLGLAARKPLIAFPSRQYRDLEEDDEGRSLIDWCDDFGDLPWALSQIRIQRVDPGIAWLAARDGWDRQGATFARLLRGEAL